MSTANLLSKEMTLFFFLIGCFPSAPAHSSSVRLLSESAYAQLSPGERLPVSAGAPSPQLIPHVLYQEDVVLQNGHQRTKLRFYSEEDPANPPLWLRVWENERPVPPLREAAPEELVRLGERSGNPVLYAWTIPTVFEADEIKRIRIRAEYPVHPVSDRPRNDSFEIYFSHWGWQPSNSELLFQFDLAPLLLAIPCLGHSPTPTLFPWFLSSWFTIRPFGYASRGFTVWWRFREPEEKERCEKISLEWYAWYR
ncbi:hypothetical protein MAMC_02118 [Methylacidimicrobium cyclopophantes]|uniref:Uncharacterized protein n=1 Tax=Methylacidimicrobium cyclopophantes TaxID=1041766 RepID=A0A5E6MJX4_9BACT|nr:hypothetical protein [Methylacidimicrobium cyclopophantes]VVM08405.1 hypothetical protein MAMC_02118 [Methylacidimicrobium cyclopophantes]